MSIDPLTHSDLCQKMRTALTTRDLPAVKDLSKHIDWARVNADLETASSPAMSLRRAVFPLLMSAYSQGNNNAYHEPGLTELDDFLTPVFQIWLDAGYNPLSDPTLREILHTSHALYGHRSGVLENLMAETSRRTLTTPDGLSTLSLVCTAGCDLRVVSACLNAGANPSDADAQGRPLVLYSLLRLDTRGSMGDADRENDQRLYVRTARHLIDHGADLSGPEPSTPQSSVSVLQRAIKCLEGSDVLFRQDPDARALHQHLKALQDNVVLAGVVDGRGDVSKPARSAPKM